MAVLLAKGLLCCCFAASVFAASDPVIHFKDGFYDVSKGFSGSCEIDDDLSNIEVHVTDCDTSCDPEIIPEFGQASTKLNTSYISSFPSNKTLMFTIEEPALRVYNIWCLTSTTSISAVAIVSDLKVAEAADGSFHCNMTFYSNVYNELLQKVEWLVNGMVVEGSETEVLKDSVTDSSGAYSLNFPLASDQPTSPGEYECRWTQEKAIPLSASMAVIGKPEEAAIDIVPFKEQYMDKDSLGILCSFYGFPAPNITWSLNGVVMDADVFTVATYGPLTISEYYIQSLEDSEDKGEYSCFANNSMGNASIAKTLHARDKLAPVWPFLGIVLQVLVLAICIAVGEKHRKKKINEKKAREQDALMR
ncbi:neuroplastin-like isoform X2 [Watersipora subatra]|uniref:neuroplastin-like isoform X1 n=1 Tax=Watersipora subatra TaxID=2589382 RepID=UPI00355C676F